MGRGKNFSEREKRFIDANKNALPLKDIAKLLFRSYAPVWKYAHAEPGWRSPIFVTESERDRLKALVAGGFCNAFIAGALGRSIAGVREQRQRLGIAAEKCGRNMDCAHCRIGLFTEMQATFKKHGVRSLAELQQRRRRLLNV